MDGISELHYLKCSCLREYEGDHFWDSVVVLAIYQIILIKRGFLIFFSFSPSFWMNCLPSKLFCFESLFWVKVWWRPQLNYIEVKITRTILTLGCVITACAGDSKTVQSSHHLSLKAASFQNNLKFKPHGWNSAVARCSILIMNDGCRLYETDSWIFTCFYGCLNFISF